VGNIAEPLMWLVAFGYGMGALVGKVTVDGVQVPYILFLASGSICMSAMNAASFEALYSAFSRMHVQKTWDAMLNAPLTLEDVVVAEWVWAASKSFLSGAAILLVVWLMGYVASPLALWVLALIPLVGLTFGALGLIITALAPSYDFFMYYFTLAITPMVLLCGVFFPVSQLPQGFQLFADALPLTHAIALARPLMLGHVPESILLHVAVLAAYALTALFVALALFRRRLLK
jgi:lipooligosaccharide transport system permease protein